MSAHAAAAQAYRAGAQLALDTPRIVALVHEGLARELCSAIFAHEQKAPHQFCLHIARAHKIVGALIVQMNFDAGAESGVRLRTLYLNVARMLVCIGNDSNPVDTLRRCADVFQILHQGVDGEIDVVGLCSR